MYCLYCVLLNAAHYRISCRSFVGQWLLAVARCSCASKQQLPLCPCAREFVPSISRTRVAVQAYSPHSRRTSSRSFLMRSRCATKWEFPRRSLCMVSGPCVVCSWCNNFTVCLHMLELCAAQSTGAGAMRAAALGALRQWQQAGGCTTDQVCRCGIAARETVNITVENACDQWWPVTFDWLDA